MTEDQLALLLEKFVHGLCTPEEAAAIDAWYDKYHDQPDISKSISAEDAAVLKKRILSNVLSGINTEENNLVKPGKSYNSIWLKVGLAAVLLVALSIFYTLDIRESRLKNENSQIQLVNNTKHIISQILPDKSIVWLSPKATVKFPKRFKISSRNITMVGECFFEITKNPKCPFVIVSEHLVTKVWGTNFKVIDKPDGIRAQVTVVSGKVSVSRNTAKSNLKEEITLFPSQQVVLYIDKNSFTANKHANITDLEIYKHVNLAFSNATLATIVSVLNVSFNTTISIQDKNLDNKVMNADLTGLNLPEILEVLTTSLKLNYEIKDHLILLGTN